MSGLVAEHLFERARFVVDGELVHDGGARLVEADDLDGDALAAEFQHGGIDRADTGQVPDMGVDDIDADALELFLEVEGGEKVLGRGEEQLAFDAVVALLAVLGQSAR